MNHKRDAMVVLTCRDLGVEACECVAEADSERHVENAMLDHIRDVHPELIAGITDEQRRDLRAQDAPGGQTDGFGVR